MSNIKNLIFAFICLFLVIPCQAGIITVDNDGPADFNNIQAAIDYSSNGDFIYVLPGSYTGTGNRDIDFLGKPITVRGVTGDPNDCIIDCQGTEAEPHRGFKFVSGEDSNSVLEAITITNGNGPVEEFFVPGSGTWLYKAAGAILCKNSGPCIINCIISSNTAGNLAGGIYNYESDTIIKNCIFNSNFTSGGGAGIFNEDSNIILTDCLFFENSTSQPGGGIYNSDSLVDINNCKFNGNVAELCGGGIYNSGSNVSIRNCSFNNNSMTESSRGGGGIANSFSSIVTITDCTLIENDGYNGGGVWNNQSSITLKDCIFIGNTGRNDGGGLYTYVSGSPSVDNCSFIDNIATSGGGILNYYSDMKLSNSYFSNNTASEHGGGMFSQNLSNPILKNCTFTYNSASWGGGLSSMGSSGTEINIKNCIIWGNSSDQIHNYGQMNISYSDIQNGWEGIGNIDTDPLFADDVFHLAGVSPCIDSGDPNYIPDINETDIEGDPRVIIRIDMGADEVYSSTSALIVIMPGTMNFIAEGLNSASQSQNVSIKNYGVGILDWQILEPNACNWLNVFPTSGQVNAGESNDTEITVNPNMAGYGTNSCQLQVVAAGAENSPQVLMVNLEVLRPELSISDSAFDFIAAGIDSNTATQVLTIQNTGFDSLNWHIEMPNDCDWLKASPSAGQAGHMETDEVILSIDHNNINYGIYSCQFSVAAPDAQNSPQMVTVNLEVLGPQIGINKDYFYFTAYGKSDTSVAGQELIITNTGFDTLNWHIEVADCNWLGVSPLSGQVTDGNSVVAITVDPNKAPVYGHNYATLNIIDENASNSPQAVTVRLQVYGPGIYVNPPGGLYIYAESNTTVEGTFELMNIGYDILHWNIETPNDCNWLTSVEPLSGEYAARESDIVTVTVDANGLENNDYHTQLLIHSPECSSKIVNLSLIVYTPSEIHVPQDYNTIQEAINAATAGDIIIVHPGTYAGFNDDKPALTIRSIEPENPVVVAATVIESRGYIYGNGTVINGLSFIYNPEAPNQFEDGIYISKSSDMQIKNCRVLNFRRAGIYIPGQYPVATIRDCVISNNGGVGVYTPGGINTSGFANIENCLITGNFGGGILVMRLLGAGGTKLYIRNNTIADNFYDTAKTAGRAITCNYYLQEDLKLSLRNSVLSNVVGPNDVEIFISADNSDNINLDIAYSNVRGGLAAVSTPIDANVVWGQGNIDADPCFADPCSGDYHLKSQGWRWDAQRKVWTWDEVTSRCIDAGNPGSPLGDELLSVPGDPDNIWGQNLRINMGAYGGTAEASMPPYDWAILADLTNDGLVNLKDYAFQAADWLNSADQQPGDLNRNSLIDISDLALLVEDWLKQTTWHE